MDKAKAVELILAELEKAEEKWPNWPEDKVHAAAIVAEEAGELLEVANSFRIEPEPISQEEYKEYLSEMEKEAVQTGAMAVRFLIHMEG